MTIKIIKQIKKYPVPEVTHNIEIHYNKRTVQLSYFIIGKNNVTFQQKILLYI